MSIEFLLDIFKNNETNESIIWSGKIFNYKELLNLYISWNKYLDQKEIGKGDVIGLIGDFTPNTIAIFLALINKQIIIVPFNNDKKNLLDKKLDIACVEKVIEIDSNDNMQLHNRPDQISNEYYDSLKHNEHSGLVLFTSGTSGEPKAAVHDFPRLLKKFKKPRGSMRTLNFLLFDHWGGLNTLFHTLANFGVVIATSDRSPNNIASMIQRYRIELLPASPTFLNLFLLSEVYRNYDLSSIKVISYGTEPMSENTLHRLAKIFPKVKLQQTYGLIELGVLRSKSKNDNSLWVQVGGEGYKTRIVDGILQIKAESAMLGYLNAENPYTEDGYFITGDMVEVDGEYIKILGRKSEIINVGGEKVYTIEIENIISEVDGVRDVTRYRQSNPIIGNIVCDDIILDDHITIKEFPKFLKKYCMEKMEPYKVPVKINIVENINYGERLKKVRTKEKYN